MYGFVITTAGEAMLARAAAGETLVLDGASVGKGVAQSAADAKALTALIDPVAEATTSSPAVAGQQISITVEYRNDMSGGLETGFALSEFGITAHVGDDPSGLLYYGSLGDAPQTVKPIDQGLDAHRFPVAIAVTGEVTVTLDYPAGGFVTWDELGDLDYDPAGSAAAVKKELEADLATRMQHIGNITEYNTVLAAASALTVDGTFFGDPSSSIYNATDKPPGTTDVQYFVMLDGTTGRRVVLAVGYSGSASGRYFGTRDILNGAWLNDWVELIGRYDLTASDDLNNIKKSGFYRLKGVTSNIPTECSWGVMAVCGDSSNTLSQMVTNHLGTNTYMRTYHDGTTWSEWKQIATTDSTIGKPQAIPMGADLNNYTEPGLYYCPADDEAITVTNCPTTHAFSLLVERGANIQAVQPLKTWMDGSGHRTEIWVRTQYPNWGVGWVQVPTVSEDPSVAGARAISAGTADLTAGSSALATGQIYLVYG